MARGRAIALALALAVAALAGEAPKSEFEAVAPPVVNLPRPDVTGIEPPPGEELSAPAEPPVTNGEAPAQGEEAASQPPTATELKAVPEYWTRGQEGLYRELDQQSGEGSETEREPAATPSTGESVAKFSIWTLVLVGVILVLYYLAKRFGGKTPLLAGAGLGRILGRIHLSPKAALYFVRVKDTVLVIGVTPTAMTRIAEFDAEEFEGKSARTEGLPGTTMHVPTSAAVAAATATTPAAAPAVSEPPLPPMDSEFLRELKAQARQESAELPGDIDDDIAALASDLERLKQAFHETTRNKE